jgi:hypothetical protein
LIQTQYGLTWWLDTMLDSDPKTGKVMYANAFKVLYKLSTDSIEHPQYYLDLSFISVTYFIMTDKYMVTNVDKLITQVGNTFLKTHKEEKMLIEWYRGVTFIPQLSIEIRASCLIWIEQGLSSCQVL